jgi:ribosome-associated translation inhibitor RaiA
MRIDIHAINMALSPDLKTYAETRIWQSARRWSRRVAWTGLWLVQSDEPAEAAKLSCRLDAWVSGAGIVTVRHADNDPYVAIDIAAARLEQAIAVNLPRARQRLQEQEVALCG